jgi:signal transduction histidine kinase
MGLAVVIFIILNTYPLFVMHNLIVNTKRDRLISSASFIASTLSMSESLTADKVKLVMGIHNIGENQRVVITNRAALSVYDTSKIDSTVGKYLILPDTATALKGLNFFTSKYDDGALKSNAAVPIMIRDSVLGTVYIHEADAEQARILSSLRVSMLWLSLFVCAFLVMLNLILTRALTQRLNKLLKAIRNIRDGSYGQSIPLDGHDELTTISDEFNEMSNRLKHVEELRRAFVADASHELRTPLSGIKLLTDSVLQTNDIDIATAREFMRDIAAEIDRLTRITEKLLILTKLDSGNLPGLEPVSLSETVLNTINLLKPIAEEAKIELRCELEEDCWIIGDRDGARQIVSNLVDNAIKYNNPGGFVNVFLFKREDNCILLVDDNGIGIPKKDYERVFERFYRVDKARARSGKGGSGLGLPIVKKHVLSFGGTISVEPSAHGGTRFKVEFPKYDKNSDK